MDIGEKVVTGEWNGKEIWRTRTAAEVLADEIRKNQEKIDEEKRTKIEFAECGKCYKKITPNLIASFGADHHDPDQTLCESCFAGAIDTAEARAETL